MAQTQGQTEAQVGAGAKAEEGSGEVGLVAAGSVGAASEVAAMVAVAWEVAGTEG